MTQSLTIEREFHFERSGRGAPKQLLGAPPVPLASAPGRTPRVAKLMALAIRFEHLIEQGIVADYADLARLGHVTRARITQIMNLSLLAPDIQEELLFLPLAERGRDPLLLKHLQPISQYADWKKQRTLWKRLKNAHG